MNVFPFGQILYELWTLPRWFTQRGSNPLLQLEGLATQPVCLWANIYQTPRQGELPDIYRLVKTNGGIYCQVISEGFNPHTPTRIGSCFQLSYEIKTITLLFVRLPGIFIAEIFRELVLFYPRSLSEGHVLVAKKAMESANIIHLYLTDLY